MTKASDNAFPSMLITEGTEPTAPAAGKQRVYIDSTTHALKRTDSAAADVTVEGGRTLDYVQFTSGVTVTATTEGTADTVATATAITFDGTTVVYIEFYAFSVRPRTDGAAGNLSLWLYDGASSIGRIGLFSTPAAQADNKPCHVLRRLTPSNAAHTYSIRASVNGGSGNVGAGAGGSTADMPGFIRITVA